MKRALIACFLIIAQHTYTSGQINRSFQDNIEFTQYLINKKQHSDAIFLLDKIDKSSLTNHQVDSMNYYLGKAHYNLQDLINSSFYFSAVRDTSLAFYFEAKFFDAYNNLYIGDLEDGASILNNLKPKANLLTELLNFEKAGLALLDRNLDDFDTLANNFKYNYFQFTDQQKALVEIGQDLRKRKKKSPFVAGLMSAIIPGSGKIYAGKTGQGLASLIGTSIFALQAIEGYRKDGPSSFRFIAFSSIFSLFYVGNIWGSVFTVKSVNDEFNEAVDHKILFDLHIPLRTIFH
ncbi:MAG: hypothetical protein AAFN93_03925 [Bacteroidota bacterium]